MDLLSETDKLANACIYMDTYAIKLKFFFIACVILLLSSSILYWMSEKNRYIKYISILITIIVIILIASKIYLLT
jgi:hypothetical protein